jgi:Tol biopolymer transport system component
MGTVAYLSPEQARGEEVDSRTDIYSFGVVLYEMATGRRPFQGETSGELVNAILTEIPRKPSDSNAAIPKRLDSIIAKALAKGREERYQSAVDLAADLAGLRTPDQRRSLFAVAGLVLVAALVTVTWITTRPSAPPTLQGVTQVTADPGEELYPSFSPDGKSLVYQSKASGRWGIYSMRVGGQNPILLSRDSASDDTQPALSPDGEHIAFRSERNGGGIFIMGAAGENARRLTTFGFNPAWSPDGNEVVCSTGFFIRPEERPSLGAKIFRVNVATGEAQQISGMEDAVQPSWSPHGYRIAYWNAPRGSRDIWTVSARGGDPVPVTNDVAVDWSPVWSRDGRFLYFSSDRGGSMNLWRVRIDERSGKKLGSFEPVTTPAQSSGFMSFLQSGQRMAYVAQARDLNLYKIGFDPLTERCKGDPLPVTQGSKPLADPAFSPDGQWIVFCPHLTPQNLFVVRNDGTALRQITQGDYLDRCPRWSPDGEKILFFSNRTGTWQLYSIKPDGSSLMRYTDAPGVGARLPKWSPDGHHLVYITGAGVAIMDASKPWKEQTPQLLPNPESGARFFVEAWSPNGQMMAGEVVQSNGTPLGLAVYHLDSRIYENIGPAGIGPLAKWLPDNRRLLFLHDGKIKLIDMGSKQVHTVFSAGPRRDVLNFSLSADARSIAFTAEAAEADVWIANLQ